MSVIAAVHRNFPSYEIYFTSSVDILIVASNDGTLPAPDWGVLSYDGIRRDLAPFRPVTPDLMESLRLGGRRAFAPLLDGDVAVNSDFYPILDLSAERTRFQRAQAEGILGLGTGRFPLGLILSGHRTPFGTAVEPAVQVQRTEKRALGAALRSGIVPPDTGHADDELRSVRHALGALRARMALHRPPEDWNLWLHDVIELDEIVHGGTTGVADDAWFGELHAFARRTEAPERVTAVIAFLRALHAWDWPVVNETGERLLILGAEPPAAPVPAELLRDALVVARLRTGDAAGARQVFDAITPRVGRSTGDARTRILEAWITAAEGVITP